MQKGLASILLSAGRRGIARLPNAAAVQIRDNAEGTYSANKAMVDADMANMRHYEALVSFEKVYAPFDGVITARNTDIGDLINAGSNSTSPAWANSSIRSTRT